MTLDEIDEEPAKIANLIKTYGEYWNPDLVDWAKKWRLLGQETKSKKSPDVNVYEERGVYVLFKDYLPVYVGKAFRQSIGYRLQLHRESRRKGPRWDSFSWFGMRGFKANGELRDLSRIPRIQPEAFIGTLEALLIAVIDPKLNARREKFQGAIHFLQSQADRPRDLEQRLSDIEQKIDSLFKTDHN